MEKSPLGRRFRARATKQHFALLPTEVPIPAEKRNVVPNIQADGLRWYVCSTMPQSERRAAESLRRAAEYLSSRNARPLVSYVPCDTMWMKRKRRAIDLPRLEVQKPMLRSYVFVGAIGGLQAIHLNLMSERNLEGHNRHGLLSVLGTRDGLPMSLPAGDVKFLNRLAERELEAGVHRTVEASPYSEGDAVHIEDGPFASYRGEVKGVDEQQSRLLVEIEIFGRATPIELDFNFVRRAA